MMKEEFNNQYVEILNKMEELLKIFEEMKKETIKLKQLYQNNPQDEKLLKNIKLHEENFKMLNKEFEILNKKAKNLSKKDI